MAEEKPTGLRAARIKSMILMYNKLMSKKEDNISIYNHEHAIAKAAKAHWYEPDTAEKYLTRYSYLAE